MSKKLLTPDYIFESSWEVCNKVGGIYTVLSTRAKTLQDKFGDNLIFIGPDFWNGDVNPLFKENKTLFSGWKKHAETVDGLKVRIGRWQVPGSPVAVLVDFHPFFAKKMKYTLGLGIIIMLIPFTHTVIMTKHPCFRIQLLRWWKAITNILD